MHTAWFMLIILIGGTLLCGFAGIRDFPESAIAARVILVVCLGAGLWHALRTRVSALAIRHAPPSGDQVRMKSLAIRACLLALLVHSVFMAYLPGWSASAFNLDYLVLLPVLLLATPHYVRRVEIRMPRPDDAYYRLGCVLARRIPWHWQEHRPLLLAWAVKLCFIPIMYAGLVEALEMLLGFDWQLNPTVLVAGLFVFGLSIDLIVATGGYLFSSRILGNEVRSTEPSWLGWLVCMICYPPLLVIFRAVRQQTDNFDWSHWLTPNEPLYWLWAGLISITWIVYWFSNLSFGFRFANLSWRGLVDYGPYRWFKHPAYLFKNIYWWLHTVPFFGVENQLDLLRNLLGLSFVSLVYYLRAKTEEQHLMAFPEYINYSKRIDRHGFFAICRKRFRCSTQ